MLHDFLNNNRDELACRCRAKVGDRVGRSATEAQLATGIPLFLDQLIRTLQIEQTKFPFDSRRVSGPAGGGTALSEVSVSAAQHGKDLLALGLTVDQVVHDYGDLCQAITDLAVERDAPFAVDEFRTLNRCLDNAISDAVTEFSYQRDALTENANIARSDERLTIFAQELRSLLGTASLAFSAAKAGNLSFTGATGGILERSLAAIDKLISNSVDDLRPAPAIELDADAFSLKDFIDDIFEAASQTAKAHGCILRAPQVDGELALVGSRDLLTAAVSNLLQNAFTFTKPGSEVMLTAYAAGDRILVDVQDQCGGLAPGAVESMFKPFSEVSGNRAGMGLGLTVAEQSVKANSGTLTVQDIPGHGCVFSMSLPRHRMMD